MDSVAGACAIVLPVSELTQWEHQRSQVHNILMALKPREIDQFNGYYSDERLIAGLKWLASESHAQPLVCKVTMRKLVLFHLSSLLDTHDLSPNQCISGFKEAVHRSRKNVSAAVGANPNSWPCPEIGLLDKACHEYEAISNYFPEIGWSSSARMEPLFRALDSLELPPFGDGDMGKWDEKWKLENCLFSYLRDRSELMTEAMATDVARAMTQYFTKVEVHGSARYIVPNWAMIFWQIFHWRLMDLPKEKVYVLAQDDPFASDSEAYLEIERSLQLPLMDHPSLDQMLAVSFIPPTPETFDSNVDDDDDEDEDDDDDAREATAAMVEDDGGESGGLVAAVMHGITNSEPENGDVVLTMPTEIEPAKVVGEFWELTTILDKVQDGNQEKLGFYYNIEKSF